MSVEPVVQGEDEGTLPMTQRPTLLAVGAQPHDPVELDDFERARMLAETHRLPLVDLAVTGVSPDATKLVPTYLPWTSAFDGLRIARLLGRPLMRLLSSRK